jgi:hypothetical protein
MIKSILNRIKLKKELHLKRPLPVSMTEFDEWADRIISAARMTATHESMKFSLATMITALGDTEAAKEDVFFIQKLHKSAANQIAVAKMEEIRAQVKARLAEEQTKKSDVLEQPKV